MKLGSNSWNTFLRDALTSRRGGATPPLYLVKTSHSRYKLIPHNHTSSYYKLSLKEIAQLSQKAMRQAADRASSFPTYSSVQKYIQRIECIANNTESLILEGEQSAKNKWCSRLPLIGMIFRFFIVRYTQSLVKNLSFEKEELITKLKSRRSPPASKEELFSVLMRRIPRHLKNIDTDDETKKYLQSYIESNIQKYSARFNCIDLFHADLMRGHTFRIEDLTCKLISSKLCRAIDPTKKQRLLSRLFPNNSSSDIMVTQAREKTQMEKGIRAISRIASGTHDAIWQRIIQATLCQGTFIALVGDLQPLDFILPENSWNDPHTNKTHHLAVDMTSLRPPVKVNIIRSSDGEMMRIEVKLEYQLNLVETESSSRFKKIVMRNAIHGILSYAVELDKEKKPKIVDCKRLLRTTDFAKISL